MWIDASTHEINDNSPLQNVTLTARDGRVSKLEHVYIRGSMVRFVIMPDMYGVVAIMSHRLKNAPMFKRFDPKNKVKAGTGMILRTCINLI